MRRIGRLAAVLAALLSCASACSRSGHRFPGANVIVVSIDTLRADLLGCYGQPLPTSPAIDAFASECLLFRRAIAAAGFTAPSHMSLFTSLQPSVHKVSNSTFGIGNIPPTGASGIARRRLSPKIPTLASCLRTAGYRTTAFVGGGNLNSAIGFDQGFDSWLEGKDSGTNGNDENLFDATKVTEWLEAHRRDRFFLFVHTYIPHAPYLPPKPWDRFDPDYAGKIPSDREAFYRIGYANYGERYQAFWKSVKPDDKRDLAHLQALYAGDVRYADDSIGGVLATLRRLGLLEKSIVVLTSDHGEQFLEHGEFEHTGVVYQELVHVPLLVRLPSPVAKTIEEPVRILDVMPTLLELVDVPLPRQIQGRSLVPCLDGPMSPVPAVSETVMRWETPIAGDTEGWQPADFHRAVRDGRFAWVQRVVGSKSDREGLYDVVADPAEKHDLLGRLELQPKLEELRSLASAHEAWCRRLAAEFESAGGSDVQLSEAQQRSLEALGYVK